MKEFTGFNEAKEEAKSFGAAFPKLPVGAYILKVLSVKYEEGKDGNSDKITLAFDIADGEHKGYFKQKFDADTSENKKWKGVFRITVPSDNDGSDRAWAKKKFAEIIAMFEDSNKGFVWKWNEQELKDKKIGGVFGEVEKEIEGKVRCWVECRWLDSVENVKNGVSQIPPKKTYVTNTTPTTTDDGFMDMSANNSVADLPF